MPTVSYGLLKFILGLMILWLVMCIIATGPGWIIAPIPLVCTIICWRTMKIHRAKMLAAEDEARGVGRFDARDN